MICGCMTTILARCSKRAAAVEQGVQSRDREASVRLGRKEMDEECSFLFQSQRGVRTCVVCFEKEITTVSLPCRHSSVCGDCMQDIRTRTNKCPICRAKIMSIRHGHYDTEFVDFALLAVETVQDGVKTLARALTPCKIAVWAFILPGVKTLARALRLCMIAVWAFIALGLVASGFFFLRTMLQQCDSRFG